jgi:hypothetical protein
VKIRALPRILVTVAAAALLSVGCTAASGSETTPRPQSAMDGPSAPAAPPAPRAAPAPVQPSEAEGSCQVSASSSGSSSSGSITSSNISSEMSTINGKRSFSCGDGPMLTIAAIEDAGVTLASEDGERVTIASGASGSVGGYTINVTSAAGGSTEFEVVPE